MNKALLLSMLIFFLPAFSAADEQPAGKSITLADLTKTCNRQTNQNKHANGYKPIIGYLIPDRSRRTLIEGCASCPEYSTVITFEYKGKTLSFASENMTEDEYRDTHFPIMNSVLSFGRKTQDTSTHLYGACAYKNLNQQYIFDTRTFAAISGSPDYTLPDSPFKIRAR